MTTIASHSSTTVELSSTSALAEIATSLPLLHELVHEAGRPADITLHRIWHAPVRTYIYHTIAPVANADSTLLERAIRLFLHANTLDSQPWYPAFKGGGANALTIPLPEPVSNAMIGEARFDFGLKRERYYRQVIAHMRPDANTGIVALRSVKGPSTISAAVRAYTLTPTADVFRLDDGTLYWHHIVTVYGAALLPPSADRLLMNLLRRLGLDQQERRTYLAEAAGFQQLCASTALALATTCPDLTLHST